MRNRMCSQLLSVDKLSKQRGNLKFKKISFSGSFLQKLEEMQDECVFHVTIIPRR